MRDIFCPIVDYNEGYPHNNLWIWVLHFKELKSGKININGKTVVTILIQLCRRPRKIVATLKNGLRRVNFEITNPWPAYLRDSGIVFKSILNAAEGLNP